MDSFEKQSHSVLDSQSLQEDQRREDVISPEEQLRLGVNSREPPSIYPVKSSPMEVSIQNVTPLHRFGHQLEVSKQDTLNSSGKIEVESKDNTPIKQRHCSCKLTRCLKLYCECFNSGSYCNGCNCLNCHNNLENEALRLEAITVILERNPVAFKAKIAGSPHGVKDLQGDVRLKIKDASHSVVGRGSSAVSHDVHNQRVNNYIRDGVPSLFSLPNNKAASGSTICTYRSSQSNTIQPHHVIEQCLIFVSKLVEIANKISGTKCETSKTRKDDKNLSLDPVQRDTNKINGSPECVLDANRIGEEYLSPATCAWMSDEKHEIMSEKEISNRVKTSQECVEAGSSVEIYLEQERQILSIFRDYLTEVANRGA